MRIDAGRVRSPSFLMRSGHASSHEEALEGLIQSRVLPQLNAAHAKAAGASGEHGIELRDLETLRLCIGIADPEPTELMLKGLAKRGISRDAILLHLFTPLARRLEDEWQSDDCSFAEVTLAVARMARLIRSGILPPILTRSRIDHPSILLATAPDDDHGFGLSIVEDFFRADGWQTDLLLAASAEEIVRRAARSHRDVVGLSLADEEKLALLSVLIRRIRRESLNPELVILVGGAAFLKSANHASSIGADAVASDAREAVECAARLVHLRRGAQ